MLHGESGNDARSRSPCRSHDLPKDVLPFLDDDLLMLSRTADVFQQIAQEKHMTYKLPKPGLTAGRILRHAEHIFEGLMDKHQPMSFKFGLTHCPRFRWYHKPYGYKHGVEKFESMVIVFASPIVTGPAFLEAALISKYGSPPATIAHRKQLLNSIMIQLHNLYLMVLLFFSPINLMSINPAMNLGVKGCQNFLPGGDTSDYGGDGPFFTYIVFRSFKYPPPVPPIQRAGG